jgi:hypothetical protein
MRRVAARRVSSGSCSSTGCHVEAGLGHAGGVGFGQSSGRRLPAWCCRRHFGPGFGQHRFRWSGCRPASGQQGGQQGRPPTRGAGWKEGVKGACMAGRSVKGGEGHAQTTREAGASHPAIVGNPAAVALARGRPVALRPRLSPGLPSDQRSPALTQKKQLVTILVVRLRACRRWSARGHDRPAKNLTHRPRDHCSGALDGQPQIMQDRADHARCVPVAQWQTACTRQLNPLPRPPCPSTAATPWPGSMAMTATGPELEGLDGLGHQGFNASMTHHAA